MVNDVSMSYVCSPFHVAAFDHVMPTGSSSDGCLTPANEAVITDFRRSCSTVAFASVPPFADWREKVVPLYVQRCAMFMLINKATTYLYLFTYWLAVYIWSTINWWQRWDQWLRRSARVILRIRVSLWATNAVQAHQLSHSARHSDCHRQNL